MRCWIRSIALCLLAALPVASEPIDVLPATLRQGEQEAAEGSIDAALWASVRNFYAQPLNVPGGELRYLCDALPQLGADLRLSPRTLAGYAPWDAAAVDSFFRDFPHLLPFRPILCFDRTQTSRAGTVQFFSRVNTVAQAGLHSCRFSLAAPSTLQLSGIVDFTGSTSRWQRRALDLDFGERVSIQLGNFQVEQDRGLFFGRFPPACTTDQSIRDNWLYADAGSWNGGAAEVKLGPAGTVSGFVHQGRDESIIATFASLRPLKALRLHAGVSHAAAGPAGHQELDSLLTIHGGLEGTLAGWSLNLETGLSPDAPRRSPLSLRLRRQHKGAALVAAITRYPDSCRVPFSRLHAQFSTRLDRSDAVLTAMTGYDIAVTLPGPLPCISRQSVQLRYLTDAQGAALDGRIAWYGTALVRYALSYAYHGASGQTIDRHRWDLTGEYDLSPRLTAAADLSYLLRPEGYRRLRANLSTCYSPSAALRFEPLATLTLKNRSPADIALGFRHSLQLFEKTFSEVNCLVPLTRCREEGVNLHARLNFLL
jgi:hypothetical protein